MKPQCGRSVLIKLVIGWVSVLVELAETESNN